MKEGSFKGFNLDIRTIIWPFQKFFSTEAKGGILLIIATLSAVFLANSPLSDAYHRVWNIQIGVSIGKFHLTKDLHLWINEGLMAIFFFLVGLEIKREILVGELSSLRHALLPIAAALGGMVVPSAIYILFNAGGYGESGWGIPMATDIAFAIGCLAILGRRIPPTLLVFLTALAIVDDLGGIFVIAFFYTEDLNVTPLMWGIGLVGLSFGLNRMGVRRTLPYILIGIGLWIVFLKSGIHATVAGVILAMTIPATRIISHSEFIKRVEEQLKFMKGQSHNSRFCPLELDHEAQQAVVEALEDACHGAGAPLQHIEHHLHPWVTYVIVPLFAFANAGVEFDLSVFGASLFDPIVIGIIGGLVVGKQIGIFSFTWLAVRSGICKLPAGTKWGHIYGVSLLGGIGFTMSLFIATLAFTDPHLLEKAKIGVFIASAISAVGGLSVLRWVSR